MSDDTTTPYVVGRGEHLLGIALRFGLEPDTIWKHPKNADLAKTRDPDLLAPGDVLNVPKPPKPTLAAVPQQTNRYRAKVPKTTVRLVFLGDTGPISNEPYELHGAGDVIKGNTDPLGRVTAEVPVATKELKVVFPKRHLEHAISVGGLDPASTPAGLRSRLAHLGVTTPGPEPVSPEVLRAFQTSNGLPVTGKADAATIARAEKLSGR
jgi:peptidoglycan hydrolase-like protein with peptidoglycan-binding domain